MFVLVGLQQADDNGLGAPRHQFTCGHAHFIFTQRDHHLALHIGTLSHTTGARQRYQRLIVAVAVQVDTLFQRIAQVTLNGTTHGVDVFKTPVAHQTHIEPLALHHAVQHGGA